MAPPSRSRGQRQRKRTARSYAPMVAAVIAALGIIAALGFFVLPADAGPSPERERGTVVAAPTVGPAAMVPTAPAVEPTEATQVDEADDAGPLLAAAGLVIDDPTAVPTATATVRVINRPTLVPTAAPTQLPTTASLLQPVATQ